MEEVKLVVTEKFEFECQNKPLLKAFLEDLDYQDSSARNKIRDYSKI